MQRPLMHLSLRKSGPSCSMRLSTTSTLEIWLICELCCGLLHLSERELRDCLARLGWPLPVWRQAGERACCRAEAWVYDGQVAACKVMSGLVTVHVQQ